jgi:hypothetical protein
MYAAVYFLEYYVDCSLVTFIMSAPPKLLISALLAMPMATLILDTFYKISPSIHDQMCDIDKTFYKYLKE